MGLGLGLRVGAWVGVRVPALVTERSLRQSAAASAFIASSTVCSAAPCAYTSRARRAANSVPSAALLTWLGLGLGLGLGVGVGVRVSVSLGGGAAHLVLALGWRARRGGQQCGDVGQQRVRRASLLERPLVRVGHGPTLAVQCCRLDRRPSQAARCHEGGGGRAVLGARCRLGLGLGPGVLGPLSIVLCRAELVVVVPAEEAGGERRAPPTRGG